MKKSILWGWVHKMFAKRKSFTAIVVIMMTVCTVFLSSCKLFGGKLADEFPKLETINIERVTFDETSGTETTMALSAEKWEAFFDIVNELKYVRYYNIRGVKYIPFDAVYYVITYENYKVILKEHQFALYKGDVCEKSIRFKSINPIEKYNELNALFEN